MVCPAGDETEEGPLLQLNDLIESLRFQDRCLRQVQNSSDEFTTFV